MKYVVLFFVVSTIWIAFEMWRAPLIEETDDGKLITKRPGRKLKDLWQRRK